MSIVTRGDGLTVTVDPDRGAKIVSILDDSGVEWLAQTDSSANTPAGSSFVEAEMCGWDECAPSIVACTVDGRSIPDHGDLWDIPFEVSGTTVRATGSSLGYVFERTITSCSGGVLISYRARTTGGAIPFLWAAHPQFSAPAGTKVEFPPSVLTVVDVMDPRLPERDFSAQLATIDTVPHRGSRKWYVDPRHNARSARIVRPDGSSLSLEWDDSCRYLGVWFDNRAFSREPVIAIEPSTGYFDSLETAILNRRVATLLPSEDLEWWIRLGGR